MSPTLRATHGSGSVAALPTRPDPVGELRFFVELPGVAIGLSKARKEGAKVPKKAKS